jgi:4-hydroxy-2-oxoheptanedioate aldolase
MKMRESRVLKVIKKGKTAISVHLHFSDPGIVEITAMYGCFDCLWLDMEHIPGDWEAMKTAINTSKLYDTDTLIRVDKGGYSPILKPLEIDATGIMVPHLMSLQEAEDIVRTTKFHPLGRRPLDGGNADGKYCQIPVKKYIEFVNRERFILVQIEDPEPMKELRDICFLPGIDAIFFGPADFSQGIGKPGETNCPEVLDARREIAARAREAGKIAGTVGGLGNLKELIDEGYNFVNIGADFIALNDYYKAIKDKLEKY